jgi:hypothetical protein
MYEVSTPTRELESARSSVTKLGASSARARELVASTSSTTTYFMLADHGKLEATRIAFDSHACASQLCTARPIRDTHVAPTKGHACHDSVTSVGAS